MLPFLVTLILIGAGIGYVAGVYLNLKIAPPQAALAGAFGGVLFGVFLRSGLGWVGGLIGALVGAAIVIAAIQILTEKR